MTLGEQAQHDFSMLGTSWCGEGISMGLLESGDLQNVCDNVLMRNHHSFL